MKSRCFPITCTSLGVILYLLLTPVVSFQLTFQESCDILLHSPSFNAQLTRKMFQTWKIVSNTNSLDYSLIPILQIWLLVVSGNIFLVLLFLVITWNGIRTYVHICSVHLWLLIPPLSHIPHMGLPQSEPDELSILLTHHYPARPLTLLLVYVYLTINFNSFSLWSYQSIWFVLSYIAI